MSEPRAYTPDELRDKLIAHLRAVAAYWTDIADAKTTQERIEGALFSALSTLDGCSSEIVAFDLVARPHPDDKQYMIDNGENWVEDGTIVSDCLHEHWHAM